eukprot:TRINITY_DN13679_c0_g3_i4.p1 TRINITY_DN13679_c0_g3~~TRINITY_DN13679_c0_g3_i4.p1  ORF type:complete len:432 (-),score=62.01 TRINITY_DN13679_c0_g3_i4:58-1353(-)
MAPSISCVRDVLEAFTTPAYRCAASIVGKEYCPRLPLHGPLGSREETLTALARLARLCYGDGFVDYDYWGQLDPPLDGEGWRVVEYICERFGDGVPIQAACYMNDHFPGVAVVGFRGTTSWEGLQQCLSLSLPIPGPRIRWAIKEACSFLLFCQKKHATEHCYVTGHSLGGYIAEAVASYTGVGGAVFNNPGPFRENQFANLAGRKRPHFEIHLTREDPLAAILFPKPETARHIAEPMWHEGSNHRICSPYMIEIEKMHGVETSVLASKKSEDEMISDWEQILATCPAPPDVDYTLRRALWYFDRHHSDDSSSDDSSSDVSSDVDSSELPEVPVRTRIGSTTTGSTVSTAATASTAALLPPTTKVPVGGKSRISNGDATPSGIATPNGFAKPHGVVAAASRGVASARSLQAVQQILSMPKEPVQRLPLQRS